MDIGSTPFVHAPFVQHLVHYLAPIDYIQLRRAFCAVRKRSGLPSVIAVVRKWVDMYLRRYVGEKATSYFEYLLCNGHFYLSGGFMLAVLRGDSVNTDQDLDFYTTELPVDDEECGMVSLAAVDILQDAEIITGCHAHGVPQEYDNIYDIQVFGHIELESLRHIQFISTKDVRETVSCFDFIFCRNIYGNGKLYVEDPDTISLQKCAAIISDKIHKNYQTLNQDMYAQRYMNRIEKYQQRGFQIDLILQDNKIEQGWPLRAPESSLWEDEWAAVGGSLCIHRSPYLEPGQRCNYCRVCKMLESNVRRYIIDKWNKWWLQHIQETSKSGIYRLYS